MSLHSAPRQELLERTDPHTSQAVADFLYHEADLLDRRQLEEWLGLFSDPLVYWLPAGQHADPCRSVSLIYDDRHRLEERVRRLQRGVAPSQDPPSRTCHLIGNVQAWKLPGSGLRVRSRNVVVEYRLGRQNVYGASVEHELEQAVGGFAIKRKVVRLVNGDAPLGNMSFLL